MIKIEQGKFSGRRCFVIASGPSIKDVDFEHLRGEITIAVNEAYKAMPYPPTFVAIGDYMLWEHVKDDYAKMKHTKVIATTGLKGTCGSNYHGDNMVALIQLSRRRKTIINDGFRWDLQNKEVNLGYNVISETVMPFVAYTGFDECYLLGCDHKQNGYGFDNPARGIDNQLIDDRVFETYEVIANSDMRTWVYNLTPDSALKTFPFMSLDDVLHPKPSKASDYIVVGYYTSNNNYKQLAERMRDSVLAQGIACEIHPRPNIIDFHSSGLRSPMPWVLNCAQCADFCLSMFEKHTDKHIFYLDADAVMERYPELLDSETLPDFDIAAPFLTNKYVQNELVSNSLIFRRTPAAHRVLKAWKDETRDRVRKMLAGQYPRPFRQAWDQQVLQDVLSEINHRIYRLPWEYAKITLTPSGQELMEGVDYNKVVISQYQASRQNKHKVGKG